MIEKLKEYKDKLNYLNEELSKPEVFSDKNYYKKLIKEFNQIQPIVNAYEQLVKYTNDQQLAKELLKKEKDAELCELLELEIEECEKKIAELNEEVRRLLLPKDENDDKNVIMEIRGGAGGDESSLFASELFRMYTHYAQKNGWKIEILSLNETELGGIKEISYIVKGNNAYSKLKYESGVHRVQRVPETESQGRIHTSTCTVAVLPEQEDVDVEILDKDLRIDTYRSSGAGGQHVNKTESAIRITHLPTGMVVTCQEERSQIKNRERAFAILKSKLYDYYKTQSDEEYAKNRRTQIGTGDRSERIRTYNYPQGRITDHRINYTIYNLQDFLNGDLDELIENLQKEDEKAKLNNLSN